MGILLNFKDSICCIQISDKRLLFYTQRQHMWTGSCRSDLKQSNSNTTKTQHQNDLCVASFQAWCYGLIVQFSSLEIVCKSGKQSLFLKAKYKQQHRDTRSFCVFFLSSSTLTLDILLMAFMF